MAPFPRVPLPFPESIILYRWVYGIFPEFLLDSPFPFGIFPKMMGFYGIPIWGRIWGTSCEPCISNLIRFGMIPLRKKKPSESKVNRMDYPGG